MLLFRYLSPESAIKVLQTGKLRASRPSTFNDPFEFRFKSTRQPTIEEARLHIHRRMQDPTFAAMMKRAGGAVHDLDTAALGFIAKYPDIVRDHIDHVLTLADETARIICFSTPEARENLLWAHYARDSDNNSHTGVRIGFDVPTQFEPGIRLLKMEYFKEPFEVDLMQDRDDPVLREEVRRTLSCKSKDWEYEDERRLVIANEFFEGDVSTCDAYWKFDPSWIAFVDMGLRISEAHFWALKTLKDEAFPHAVLRKATMSEVAYQFEYEVIRPSEPR